MEAKRNIFLYLVMICFFSGFAFGSIQTVNSENPEEVGLFRKVMCGYQGWFAASTDDLVYDIGWAHWCLAENEPTPDTITFDAWPDYSEYPRHVLSFPRNYHWYYPDQTEAGFYSSVKRETVLLHCKWMHDYGIDGIFLQRFVTELKEPAIRARRNIILRYILEGAQQYRLKVAIMYDISGTTVREINSTLMEDWVFLVNEMKLPKHPCYLYHHDKNGLWLPVVAVWGQGFHGVGSNEQAIEMIDFFKTGKLPAGSEQDIIAYPRYRVTLMGGVPSFWRSGDRDSKSGYMNVYSRFDIISPWSVGRIKNETEAVQWRSRNISGDILTAAQQGQEYIPVCFPGFSFYNLLKALNQTPGELSGTGSLKRPFLSRTMRGEFNEIPRNGGHFMWSQFYQWWNGGAGMFYVAMFDEVDESTAIFKLATSKDKVPVTGDFLTLDVDGYNLKSDHYLWMTGTVSFIIKHNLIFPQRQPFRFNSNAFKVVRQTQIKEEKEMDSAKIDIAPGTRPVYKAVIYKSGNAGRFGKLKTIYRDEFDGNVYSYTDNSLTEGKNYTYILVGFNSFGIPVAFSNRVGI